MREFFDKWYGDRCPFWTWPATICGPALLGVVAVLVNGHIELLSCQAKGGNAVRADGCYVVTMKKID